MPPAQRPPVPCTRCHGTRFVRVIPREHGANPWVAPMTLTQAPNIHDAGLFSSHLTAGSPRFDEGWGLVETYVCLTCGFMEWYCHAPQKIPIGPEYNTELVDYAPAGPYR
jgi:hypothetical protein